MLQDSRVYLSNHVVRNYQPKKIFSTVLSILMISACSVEDDEVGNQSVNNHASLSVPRAIQVAELPLTCASTLEASIAIDNGIAQPMEIVNGKVIYKITERALGQHTFTIEFKCQFTQTLMLATATVDQEIIDGPNRIVFENNDYFIPDSDGDNVNNLLELAMGTDPFTRPDSLDITPPTEPDSLRASNITVNSVELTWNPASDPDSGIVIYKVYRDEKVVKDKIDSPYVDTGLADNTQYTYKITAINGTAIEGPPATVQITTLSTADTTPPTAPGIPQVDNVTPSGITLSWVPATDTQSGIVSYSIYRDNVRVETVDVPFYNDTGLSESTLYRYQVTAINGASIEGPKSTTKEITTLAATDISPPTAPGAPLSHNVTKDSIELFWLLASDAQSRVVNYNIYRDNNFLVTVTTPPFVDTGLIVVKGYTYQISAVNGASIEGPKSDAVTLSTLIESDSTPPNAPGSPQAGLITDQNIVLSWGRALDVQSGIVDYHVYRDGIVITTVNVPTFTDQEVLPSTTYTYQVSAVNGVSLEGPQSMATTLTTPSTSPQSVTPLNATLTDAPSLIIYGVLR